MKFKNKSIQISCDGGAATGKSTGAKMIAKKYKLKFDLLSDESDKICEKFGVWIKKSMYGRTYKGIDRSTFLIMKGKVVKVWRKVKVNNHVEEVIDTIKQMNK